MHSDATLCNSVHYATVYIMHSDAIVNIMHSDATVNIMHSDAILCNNVDHAL